MSLGKLILEKSLITSTRQLCIRNPVSRNSSMAGSIWTQQYSVAKPFQNSSLLNERSSYTEPTDFSNVQIRSYSSMPAKDKIEKLFFKTIVYTIDTVQKVRATEGYRKLKAYLINMCCLIIIKSKKLVLENKTVKSYIDGFNKKMAEARKGGGGGKCE